MVEEQVLTHTQALKGVGREVEVIRDIDRFNSIAPEWDQLVKEWAPDRMFLSHAWFRTWWETFGKNKDLHVITVRSCGRLVAVAPMMRTRASIYGLKARAVHAIYNAHTPRYDFIIAGDEAARSYEAIWNALMRERSCEVIVLAQIPEESQTIASIEKVGKCSGWLTGQWIAPVSPYIPLGCDYATYFASLRSRCRFNLTKRYARLRRIGSVDMEVVTEREAVDEAIGDGFRIEAAAWKGENGTAILSDPSVMDFYIRLAKREADLGQLRLTFLRVGGKRIAFNYLLQNGNKLYAVKIGYDPQYHAYSPGNMLLNLILKDACARGIEEYDLLGGDDEWKFEWTRTIREHRWLFLFRPRIWPRVLHYLKFGVVSAAKAYANPNN